MYNIGARYAIIGRVTNGTAVNAYVVKDAQTNKIYPIEKGIVEQLALNKQIYNCSAQVYGNIVNLRGINCKLNRLPRYNENGQLVEEDKKAIKKQTAEFELVGKVQKGRVVSAYVLRPLNSENGQLIKMSRDSVMNLAKSGRISNAKCQSNKNSIMLRGAAGFNLTQLKVYEG